MSFDDAKPPCASFEDRPGCIQTALTILGDKWSPLLLGQLIEDEKTFGELEIALAGISPRTLSQRLDRLEQEQIIEKRQYCKHPPRYKYTPTKKGEDLQQVLRQMAEWGNKYHGGSKLLSTSKP